MEYSVSKTKFKEWKYGKMVFGFNCRSDFSGHWEIKFRSLPNDLEIVKK